MLIIDRKIGEGLYIGGSYVKVLPGGTKNRIRLGIEAPREVPVLREELLGTASQPSGNRPVARKAA